MTLGEKLRSVLAIRYNINAKKTMLSLTSFAKREAKHHFGNASFGSILILSCIDRLTIKMLSEMDAKRKVFCFSEFGEDKYKKSKRYKKHIMDVLELIQNMQIIYAPVTMKHLFKELEANKDIEFKYFNPETFEVSDLLKEVC